MSFSPSDIAGLVGWWKADALALNDGDAVGTWTDSSGAGRDATQSTAGAKPTYKANILNGKPVVRFDGGDVLTFTTLTLPAWSLFYVCKLTAVGGFTGPFGMRVAGEAGVQIVGDGAGPSWIPHVCVKNAADAESINKKATTTYSMPMASFVLHAWRSTPTLYINGASDALANGVGGYGLTGGGTIGRGYSTANVTGDIAEIILYDSAISDANRALVEAYLFERYFYPSAVEAVGVGAIEDAALRASVTAVEAVGVGAIEAALSPADVVGRDTPCIAAGDGVTMASLLTAPESMRAILDESAALWATREAADAAAVVATETHAARLAVAETDASAVALGDVSAAMILLDPAPTADWIRGTGWAAISGTGWPAVTRGR